MHRFFCQKQSEKRVSDSKQNFQILDCHSLTVFQPLLFKYQVSPSEANSGIAWPSTVPTQFSNGTFSVSYANQQRISRFAARLRPDIIINCTIQIEIADTCFLLLLYILKSQLTKEIREQVTGSRICCQLDHLNQVIDTHRYTSTSSD